MGLLKYAAASMGMTVQSTKRATQMLGGSPTANVTPSYSNTTNSSTSSQETNNNTEVKAPVNVHVYGTDPKSTANAVEEKVKTLLVRNTKSALAH